MQDYQFTASAEKIHPSPVKRMDRRTEGQRVRSKNNSNFNCRTLKGAPPNTKKRSIRRMIYQDPTAPPPYPFLPVSAFAVKFCLGFFALETAKLIPAAAKKSAAPPKRK